VEGDPKFEFYVPKLAYPAKLFTLFWLDGSRTDEDMIALFAVCFEEFFSLRVCRFALDETFTSDPDPSCSPWLFIYIFFIDPCPIFELLFFLFICCWSWDVGPPPFDKL
jgi:hypothetical protein